MKRMSTCWPLNRFGLTALFTLLLLTVSNLHAQTATWLFEGGAGSAGAENTKAVCADAAGNVYVTGSFSNTVDFDFGGGTANLVSNGSNDIFIASYTSTGAYRWAVRAGGTAADNGNPAGGICTDGTNVYVTGSYNGASTMFGATSLTPNGGAGQDAFVAKLNAATGAWTWAVSYGGTTNLDFGTGMCLDQLGNPYVTGAFNNTMSGACANVSGGGTDLFVMKLNPASGACVWMSNGGSSGNEAAAGGSICYDPLTTEIVVTSCFSTGTATFGAFTISFSGLNDMCILELNSTTGAWLGAVGTGGTGTDDAIGCAFDPSTGDIMVCGAYSGNIILPGGIPLSNTGGLDAWVGRYSISSNGFVWARTAVGTAGERANAVAVDGAGTVAVVGQYVTNPTTFGALSLTNTNSGGFDDAFVVGYSAATGTELWATKNTNSGVQPSANSAKAIALIPSSTSYWISGQYAQGCTFGSLGAMNSNGFNDFFVAKLNVVAPLTASQFQTNITCNGICNGSAGVIASGGVSPYTYSWSPSGGSSSGASGLCAQNYTCTITDNVGTQITKTFTITQPPALTSSVASQTNVACFGGNTGAATITAGGGTGSLTYNWTPGNPTGDGTVSVSGLTAGTWTCTITDANSCTRNQTVNITQPTAIVVSAASQTNISCFGGSNGAASINTPTGGAGGYTYNWTPGNPTGDGTVSVSGLTAGTWTCTVTDANSCVATQTFNITAPSAIVVTPASQTNISCFGGSNGAASINTPTGGAGGYTYNWTPGNPTGDGTVSVSGLTAGTWTCTVTDANSCVASQTFNITAPTALVVTSASQTNISCFGGSNGAASINTPTGGAGGYTYNWTPGNPTGDGTVSVSGLTAGTWTCTVTDANSCVATQTFNITAPSAIVVTPASQTNISCFGGSNGAASINTPTGGAGGYTYNWTPGNPTGDGTVSVSGLTAGTWTCTVTDANSCVATQTFNITAPTAIVVTPASQTNISCFGGSNGAASINTPTGGAGGYTYNWTPGNPTGDGTVSVSGLTAGTWTCTVTDANSCVATQTFDITQPSAISASASATPESCAGNDGTATVNASGGTGSLTYSWAPSGGTAAIATGLSAGNYTCTVTDANSCVATASTTVTGTGGPSAAISSQTNVSCNASCDGAATVLASGGAGGYTYAWSPSGGTAATATGLCSGSYTCTVTDAGSCTATATVNITQPSVLVLTAASQTNISCNSGSNGAASVNAATGGSGGYSYNWTPGNPTGDGTTSVSGLTSGTWTCTVTDANSCVSTATFNITEPTALVVSPQSQTNIACNGDNSGAASVTVSGGAGGNTFNWTPGNPTGDGSASVTNLTAGSWTCSVTDVNGCISTATFSLTQPTAISVSTTTTPESCTGNDGTATVSPSGGTPGYTYSWAPSGGTGSTATGLAAGNYTCTITDANGCTATPAVNVAGNGSGPSVSIGSSTNVSCFGGANGSATVNVSGGATPYTFAWTPTGGTAATAAGLAAGTYTCTVTDDNGCTGTETVIITAPTLLTVSITPVSAICDGQSANLVTSVNGGVASYTYNWMPGSMSTANVSVSPSVTTGYTVTVTDANGCTANDAVTVNVNPLPTLTITTTPSNSIVCTGNQATLTATGAQSYSWTGGVTNGLAFVPPSTGTYTVTGTSAAGCSSTAQVTLTVQACSNQTQLNTTWCGATNCTNNDLIVANTVSGATNYEFWFQNNSLGYNQTRQKGNGIASISLSWIAGLQYGVTYQVRVRAFVGGVWQAYGPTCSLTMAPAVPVPQLTNCAATNLTLSNTLFLNSVAGAQDYEWEITNSTQPYTLVIQRGSPTASFGLTSFAGLQYGRTYNVRIRAKVGGVWGSYGPTCTFSMQSSPPSTQLTATCGAVGVTSGTVLAWSAVTGATNYRINIMNSSLGYSQTKTKGSSGTTMGVNQFSGLVINNTYTVTISSYIGGAWGPFGPSCTITMGASVRMAPEEAEENNADFNFGISMYPNPLGNGVNPTINITGADQQEAIVTIIDLSGRAVVTYNLYVEGDAYSAGLTEFPDLVAGMYIMQVQIGDKVQNRKFIAE